MPPEKLRYWAELYCCMLLGADAEYFRMSEYYRQEDEWHHSWDHRSDACDIFCPMDLAAAADWFNRGWNRQHKDRRKLVANPDGMAAMIDHLIGIGSTIEKQRYDRGMRRYAHEQKNPCMCQYCKDNRIRWVQQ